MKPNLRQTMNFWGILLTGIVMVLISALPALSAGSEMVTVHVEAKYRPGEKHPASSREKENKQGGGYLLAYSADQEFPYRFELIDSSRLLRGGKIISADDLPTPCTARVTFQRLKSGYSNVLTLEVLALDAGAGRTWKNSDQE